MNPYKRILVIRLSALGDIILSFPTFAALRRYYPDAEITLLTLRQFGKLVDGCPYFDRVWTIGHWSWKQPGAWIDFAKDLRNYDFDCVYDLQRNDRTRILSFFAPRRLAKKWYDRKGGAFSYDAEALVATDTSVFAAPDLGWMCSDVSGFPVQSPFVILVPGSAPQHPGKRWPAEKYAELAQKILDAGCTPVLVGAAAETDALDHIAGAVPGIVNLCGKTSMQDIAGLARHAVSAVGNDTGPMHLISAAGCPVISLFSGVSNPEQSAPKGAGVLVLREENIADISVEDVFALFQEIMASSNKRA